MTIEVLLVAGIAATLLAMALPGFFALKHRLELRLAADYFFGSLQLARSEAIKRNGRVVICKSADAIGCSASGGWEQGWIVFHDANNDALRQPDERLISQHQGTSANVHMTGNGNVNRYVSFTATGSTHLTSHAFQAGTVMVCLVDNSAASARKIVINSTGRMRMADAMQAQCPA